MHENGRRAFFCGSAVAGAALLVGACRSSGTDEPEVTATEDMMREHGVLRRALVVYGEAALRLRINDDAVPAAALRETAKLFRSFGEDYHEKKLEEAYVFPRVKSGGGAASALTDVLTSQHERGRQITDYVLSVTAAPKLGARSAELAGVLQAFVRMYEAHTAHEDTVVFPAWKKALSKSELEEMGEKFEDIEHAQFGADGYEHAVERISKIETELDLGDIAKLTAPPPPGT
ncbi:MAG TPA: hemerythrin domain-containing protein [Polyangiaceae bacterium]|jgi:hemerythrin-like domain-containing protein|nr:hemerythrin domain-containing protein [Polyangiaceae bacterium]